MNTEIGILRNQNAEIMKIDQPIITYVLLNLRECFLGKEAHGFQKPPQVEKVDQTNDDNVQDDVQCFLNDMAEV